MKETKLKKKEIQELIAKAKKGDRRSFRKLQDQYQKRIRNIVKQSFVIYQISPSPSIIEYLENEAKNSILWKAIKKYKRYRRRRVIFFTYFRKTLKNEIAKLIKAEYKDKDKKSRNKKYPIHFTSMDAPISEDDERTGHDIIPDPNQHTAEEIKSENEKELTILKFFTDAERQVLELKGEGYNPKEMAKKLNRSVSGIYYILNKIKRKIKQLKWKLKKHPHLEQKNLWDKSRVYKKFEYIMKKPWVRKKYFGTTSLKKLRKLGIIA